MQFKTQVRLLLFQQICTKRIINVISIHSVVNLMQGPQPLPKLFSTEGDLVLPLSISNTLYFLKVIQQLLMSSSWSSKTVLHRGRSSAKSSSSCLCLPRGLPKLFSTEGDLVLPLSISNTLYFLKVIQQLLMSSSSSSKTRFPQRAIQCFLFQFPVPSLFHKVTQQLLMSSSSSSRHLYSSLYLLYVSINKQLIIFQNFFGVLSRLSQDKGYKTFPQLKCLRGATERCDAGKHVARELRVGGGAYSKVTGKTELKYFT